MADGLPTLPAEQRHRLQVHADYLGRLGRRSLAAALRQALAEASPAPTFRSDLRTAARALRGTSWPGSLAEDMEQRAARLDRYADAVEEGPAALVEPELQLLRKAIYDPGRFVARENHTDGLPNELHVWQAKAALVALGLAPAADPAGEGEARSDG